MQKFSIIVWLTHMTYALEGLDFLLNGSLSKMLGLENLDILFEVEIVEGITFNYEVEVNSPASARLNPGATIKLEEGFSISYEFQDIFIGVAIVETLIEFSKTQNKEVLKRTFWENWGITPDMLKESFINLGGKSLKHKDSYSSMYKKYISQNLQELMDEWYEEIWE